MGATLGSRALMETSSSFRAECEGGDGWRETLAETSVVVLHYLLSTDACFLSRNVREFSRSILEGGDEDSESLVRRIGDAEGELGQDLELVLLTFVYPGCGIHSCAIAPRPLFFKVVRLRNKRP